MIKPYSMSQKFCDHFLEIKILAKGKKDISQLGSEAWITDMAFMIDINIHFSSLN